MPKLAIKQPAHDLPPIAGLPLMGHLLESLSVHFKRIDATVPISAGILTSDVMPSYPGLLAQGKSAFDAIESYRGDKFYKSALGVAHVPSSLTLRQRLDTRAGDLFESVPGMIEALLTGQRPDYGWLPLDVATFAMDNSGTNKEGVGRTYTRVDGYCPLAAYLGSHGFCLELALHPGAQHSAHKTNFNLERLVPMAQRLSQRAQQAPILTRLGSGFDSPDLMHNLQTRNRAGLPQVDWLIE